MKKTKQQEIEELKGQLSECREENTRNEKRLFELKSVLFQNSFNHKFDDIYPAVRDLIEFRERRREETNVTIEILREQTRRYWRLIRSLSGDQTLQKEIESRNMDHKLGDVCGNIDVNAF